MATLVHPSSAESTTSQLDLFSVPPSQTSLEEGSFTKYHPVSVLTSTGPIEFTISAENSNYIDLANSFLYVHASVTTATGADLAKNVEIAPECNFLHTLWTQVDVYLNVSLVTQSNNNYPYRAYIENLLSFGQDAKHSQLSALLWHRNTSEHFDTRGATNLGYTKRKALAAESKEMDMMGKLHLDLFFQNRYLLNGVEVRLRLIRSNDLFCLHGNANQADNKVSLKEVTLFVRKVKPNPAVQLAHVKALQHGTAKYPLRRVEVKSFTVPTGNRSITKENLFLGQLPTRMVVGVVDNDAYNGVITKSPFNFKHNSINFMTIYRDGVQIPSKPLQPDFTNDRFVRSYVRLFTQTGQYYRDTGNAISREQYKDGCALFAFDLTPQMDSSEVGFELIKHGNIRIEIHFAIAMHVLLRSLCLPNTTTCWRLIKTETLLLTIQDEHVANRTLAQEGFEKQNHL